ncbi:MAG: hypothetical protein OXC62_14295 [Aestuariivita sp.]|nr:hypothetical protein [Aestuariivita sp.]
MNERNDLDFGALKGPVKPELKTVESEEDRTVFEPWPSRSPTPPTMGSLQPKEKPLVSLEAQVSIRGPGYIIERFKKLCKDDRRSYYNMLEMMMNRWDD